MIESEGQLSLFPPAPVAVAEGAEGRYVEARLIALVGRPVDLTLTDNRSRFLSVRPGQERLVVRLHRCFVDASEAVLAAVAQVVSRPRGTRTPSTALTILRDHFERHGPPPTDRSGRLSPIGRTLDLRTVRDEVNARYFAGALDVGITWGRAARRRRMPRSIRLGSFDPRSNVVRIHRALDAPRVSRYVVASIVHHEMLHAAMPPERCGGGRRVVHSRAFRARERAFEDHERAEAWIERHLPWLLRRAKNGAI